MGIALAAAVILFSRLFCGYICPIGTVEDLLSKARRGLKLRPVTIRNGSVADKALRLIKYILLFWIFYMTATSSELFCKNLDPYYAVATGFKGEITLWMSVTTVATVLLAGFFIGGVCSFIKLLWRRELLQRLAYFQAYMNRLARTRQILPYYLPDRDGYGVTIPLTACIFAGACAVLFL